MQPKLKAVGEKPILKLDKTQIERCAKMGDQLVAEIQGEIDKLRKHPDLYIKVQAHDHIRSYVRYMAFMGMENSYMRGTMSISLDPNLSNSDEAKSYRNTMRNNTSDKHAIFENCMASRLEIYPNVELKGIIAKLKRMFGLLK